MKNKTFDCVDMMHEGAARIYEETKDMSVDEELRFWKRRHKEAEQTLLATREEGADK